MFQSAYPPNHLKMGALPEPQNWNVCRGKLASIWVNMQLQKKCFLEMVMLSLYQCLCAWVLNSWHSQLVFTHKEWRIMQCCVVARRKSCFFQWFQIMARKSIICNIFFPNSLFYRLIYNHYFARFSDFYCDLNSRSWFDPNTEWMKNPSDKRLSTG